MTRKLGDLTLTMVNGGNFRLDGGAMHGVVPKVIWNKLVSCDEHNRCTYSTNCLLVEHSGKRILIETGNGDKFPQKLKDIYGIDHDRSIVDALREIGVDPMSIDYVILTHLHFDHAGGTTTTTESGEVIPVFPRAKHILQTRELTAARARHERNRASYLPENFEPLATNNLLWLVDGETEILPGISVVPTPGHTPGHQSVLLGTGNERAMFLGDVIPTSVHIPLPYVMGYDLDVEATLASKKAIYDFASNGCLLLFGHDQHHGTRLATDPKGRPIAGQMEDL